MDTRNRPALEYLAQNPQKQFLEWKQIAVLPEYYGYVECNIESLPMFKLLLLGSDCPIAKQFLYNKQMDNFSLQIWGKLSQKLPENTIILDIGSHVGIYSITANLINNRVMIHSFEPQPQNYSRQLDNFKINGLKLNNCHPIAISDYDGQAQFTTQTSIGFLSSGGKIGFNEKGNNFLTYCCTIDKMFNPGNMHLLKLCKIDVEGNEVKVLNGMKQALHTAKPDMIIEIIDGQVGYELQQILQPLGYKFWVIDERGSLEPVNHLQPIIDENRYLNMHKLNRLVSTRENPL